MIRMENKVLVFGHKSPDTDSICSSIVKEILSHKDGWDCVEARRLGNINKETQYVLDYLGIKAPELLEKVEEGQQVLLVDHNEFGQSVEGIEKAEILDEQITIEYQISKHQTHYITQQSHMAVHQQYYLKNSNNVIIK